MLGRQQEARRSTDKGELMPALEQNYIEKHRSTNLTADALSKAGIGVECASVLHKTG